MRTKILGLSVNLGVGVIAILVLHICLPLHSRSGQSVSATSNPGADLGQPRITISTAPTKQFPPDFARIPQTSLKAGDAISAPGTSQAQGAVTTNDIPQTGVVSHGGHGGGSGGR